MSDKLLQLDARDNAAVALEPLTAGTSVVLGGNLLQIKENIPAKHKVALTDLAAGDSVVLYGVPVAEATQPIARGALLTTENLAPRAASYSAARHFVPYSPPAVEAWKQRTFLGYPRPDGSFGTRNVWLVLPLVFCENRNVERLREAMEEELGFRAPSPLRDRVRQYIARRNGRQFDPGAQTGRSETYKNIDGLRFLTHAGGCGGTRQDARRLCALLAGYIAHPNVAGATVLSLGCQNATVAWLEEELAARSSSKRILVWDQQKIGSDARLMEQALDGTLAALDEADCVERRPVPLAALTVGLKCGGSDGFSGVSANPVVGCVSDMLGALGGRTILSEFPELHGVEQALIDRTVSDEMAARFASLMETYAAQARQAGSGFESNPSPGNIADGLITGAMKSAGAARKGGRGPIRGVLDYPEPVRETGLNLLLTPGNDVEAVTAQVGAGANLVLFTTGLGTPTGNAIAPVVKISTNTELARRMPETIDFDAGAIVRGEESIEECAERLLNFSIEVASGRLTRAEQLGQYDFIPWKRGVSL
jgi:altronate hydrolase